MVNFRIILAGLIALAVAVAPVGAALAASHASGKQVMHDCPSKAAAPDCQSCDTKAKPNCQNDPCSFIKCCKLLGIVTAPPAGFTYTLLSPLTFDPQKPPDWQLRPQPPPPRT